MSISAAIVFSPSGHELGWQARASLAALADAGVQLLYAQTGATLPLPDGPKDSVWALVADEEDLLRARSAGFLTCAILPEGEAVPLGRQALADVIAHGWAEVSFGLLDDFAEGRGAEDLDASCRVLIVAGSPEPSSPELVASLASAADYVIACDAGACVCKAAGIAPDAFVGDGDSADPEALAWVRSVASRCISFPPEKYATDLALAIEAARHEAARRGAALKLTLTCGTGGRPDHALAVIGQLLAAADAFPKLIEDGFELRILSQKGASCWQLPKDAQGRALSVIALAEGTVVSERGMRWDLTYRALPLLGDEGISNIVASSSAEVECHAGACAVYLQR